MSSVLLKNCKGRWAAVTDRDTCPCFCLTWMSNTQLQTEIKWWHQCSALSAGRLAGRSQCCRGWTSLSLGSHAVAMAEDNSLRRMQVLPLLLAPFPPWLPVVLPPFFLFVFLVKERTPLGRASGFSCPHFDREIPKLFCLSAFSQDDRYSERVGSLFAQVLWN